MQQLDEETRKRRAEIAKVQRRRKYTVGKFVSQVKAVLLALLVLLFVSLLVFPGWMSAAKKGELEAYAKKKGLIPVSTAQENFVSEKKEAQVQSEGSVTESSFKKETKEAKKEPEPEPEPVIQYETLSIRCIGDVMAHKSQVDGALNKETKTYDFSSHLKYVTPYLQTADLALANVETTFKGEGPYNGYPSFNAPDILAQNVKDMGIDVAILANNHIMDQGLTVLQRSVDLLRENDMVVIGSKHETEKRYAIVEVKGIKVGVLAYTYETPRNGGKRTINAAVLSSSAEECINSFTQDSYEILDKDLAVIKEQMKLCREDGAQIVVLYMHWGEEYQKSSNPFQKYMAKAMAEAGADIIFGSHPHVPQEIQLIEVKDAEDKLVKTVPVFYSMGNFISNQRTESLSGTYGADAAARTEQEYIACIDLTFCINDSTFVIDKTSFIPLWVDREKMSNGLYTYGVIPLTADFENNEMLKRTGHTERAKKALDAMTKQIGENFLNRDICQLKENATIVNEIKINTVIENTKENEKEVEKTTFKPKP